MLPNYIDPHPAGWVRRITGISQGKADEVITGLDPDEPDTRYRLLKESSLCRHGFIGVSRPVRDGEGHVINVGLTDLGDSLLGCLKDGLVWNLAGVCPDMEATHKYWRRRLKKATDPDEEVFDHIPTYTHAWMEPMKAEIVPRHIEMWLEALAITKSHNDAIFTMIAELPDTPYRVVKDEAFHHRMKIWTPV